MSESDTKSNERIARDTKASLKEVGFAAGQGLFSVLVFAVIVAISGALGVLVYQGVIESGPYLLVVGILLGFFLGHVDAVTWCRSTAPSRNGVASPNGRYPNGVADRSGFPE